jgi:hypothetical protein
MDKQHISSSRRVAKGLACVLWAVGTAYLVNIELQAAKPDWVVVGAIPCVWAAVIALPVLGGRAWAEKQRTAAVLLWLSAIVGSAYTISGTLGRQAEARDVKIAAAAEAATLRRSIERELAQAKASLETARAKCGQGRECTAATKWTMSVYEGAVAGHEHRLSKLQASAPDAGEKRIAALLGFVTAMSLEKRAELVGLVLPALFGLLIELAALSLAMYGWGHGAQAGRREAEHTDLTGQSNFPAIGAHDASNVVAMFRPSDDQDGGEIAPRLPRGPKPDGRKERVLASISTDLALGRSFPSQRKLCEQFGIARSTLSDWLKEWEEAGHIPERRTVGRCKALATA